MKSACFSVMVLMAASALAAPDVFIGTSGLGHVSPAAAYPFGMVQAGPDTSARPEKFVSDWAHTCGYQHTDEWLWRFSQTHLFGTGCPSFGDIGLLPYAAGFDGSRHPAKMLKATERGEAGHYAVTIDEDGERVDCEVAALARSAVYRFRFSKPSGVKLLIDLRRLAVSSYEYGLSLGFCRYVVNVVPVKGYEPLLLEPCQFRFVVDDCTEGVQMLPSAFKEFFGFAYGPYDAGAETGLLVYFDGHNSLMFNLP